ncbi:MAG: deoxyribodipyrimidine photo-lyase [Ginsengibacter sp.]
MEKQKINICWLRRDLRLFDNTALYHALTSPFPVLLIFIFDTNILDHLDNNSDRRVAFIHETLLEINGTIMEFGSSVMVFHDTPLSAFAKIAEEYQIEGIFANHDYEPYAMERDNKIKEFANQHQINFHTFKDQVIFEKTEVMKPDESPYTIFTPYSKIWKQKYNESEVISYSSEKHLDNLLKTKPFAFPSLKEIGFKQIISGVAKPEMSEELIRHYSETRNIPGIEGTSHVSVHLRFGTISVRQTVEIAKQLSEQWLNELIWREFFMMILVHFPEVVHHNFKRKYDDIKWRNNEKEFELWCKGETGYPMVDAGMRQLNETGWMHNRVRMVVAGFLCKHLLIDWRWGEAYFAEKLLDYELSSNNGNWQWAAGTGCDAAPYFRIFNPSEQIKKFDPQLVYIKRWIRNFRPGYLPEIVKHEFARSRALEVYKNSLRNN